MLLVFSSFVIAYFLVDNLFWWMFLRYNEYLLIYHVMGAVVGQFAIYCCSVGYFIYVIIENNKNNIKRDTVSDISSYRYSAYVDTSTPKSSVPSRTNSVDVI